MVARSLHACALTFWQTASVINEDSGLANLLAEAYDSHVEAKRIIYIQQTQMQTHLPDDNSLLGQLLSNISDYK